MNAQLDHPRLWHPTEGRGQLLGPDGEVLWEEDWQENALHDAGEQSMLDVYLREQANPAKHLGLLNDGSVAETDGTMSAVTETATPGSNGYNRQQIAAGDWGSGILDAGDWQYTAAEKTFGPVTGSALTATHASLSSTATGAGLLILTVALSATTVIAVNQSFKYTLRFKMQ